MKGPIDHDLCDNSLLTCDVEKAFIGQPERLILPVVRYGAVGKEQALGVEWGPAEEENNHHRHCQTHNNRPQSITARHIKTRPYLRGFDYHGGVTLNIAWATFKGMDALHITWRDLKRLMDGRDAKRQHANMLSGM